MLSDTFKGGVDMAQASMRYLYSRARGLGPSSFSDDELSEQELRFGIKRFRDTYVGGLYNEGNTCFINSVVQSLASCDSVIEYTSQVGGMQNNLSTHLHKLLHDLNRIKRTRHNCSTNKLMSKIGGHSRWARLDQEDAQEFFQQLLVGLERDFKSRSAQNAQSAQNGTQSDQNGSQNDAQSVQESKTKSCVRITPFDGEFATRVGCLECSDMEGIRRGVLSSVDLALDLRSSEFDLKKLLADYCRMEHITDVECYRCTLVAYEQKLSTFLASNKDERLCAQLAERVEQVRQALLAKVIDEKAYPQLKAISHKVTSTKTKQSLFARPMARVLMVHINRSVFDMVTGYSRKNYAPVNFPLRLDMSHFATDPHSEHNMDASKPMAPTPEHPEVYVLKATVIHYGSANFGHYVCFRKFNGFWWRISDDTVDLTTESQVLASQGVFMLFYEREDCVHTDPRLQADLEALAANPE